MQLHTCFTSIASIFAALAFGVRGGTWATFLALWFTRLVLFSLLLRTYIIPFVVTFFSKHIRVRSISIRSIRGLYIRKGPNIWRIDRIGFSCRKVKGGSRRVSITLEGLKLVIEESTSIKPSTTSREQRHSLSLADFRPSLMAFRLWFLLSGVYELLSPIVRPAVLFLFVSLLRFGIQRLPWLIQVLHFEVQSAELTFSSLPGTKILVEEATLNAALAFSQAEPAAIGEETDLNPSHADVSLSIADWKARFVKSTQRSWDRAWGKTQGLASASLQIKRVLGSTSIDCRFTSSSIVG